MAQPAPPILGSTLLSTALKNSSPRLHPASPGCRSVDQALQGGFRYGEITSVAGATGMGKSLISLHAAASHLIAHKTGEVVFIDTTGSFSPLRLRDVLILHLSRAFTQARYEQSGYVYEKVSGTAAAESLDMLQNQATAMLDRVSIMRVFDFPGVVEAIAEMSERFEKIVDAREQASREVEAAGTEEPVKEVLMHERDSTELGQHQSEFTPTKPIGMIIIDNIANITSSMMAKNQTHGQALLTTTLRSIHTLTQFYHLCTILLNAAVGLGNPAPNHSMYAPAYRPSDNASIFASTKGKPALGQLYSYLIDTSIFLSSVPRTSEDARRAYHSAAGGGEGGTQKYDTVMILEVLKDRYGNREGDWGAFEIGPGGEIKGFE